MSWLAKWASVALFMTLLLAGANLGAAAEADGARPNWAPESGKLLATAGVTQLEGAGGGGLVPWALITGYGTRDAIGANSHYTYVHTPGFDLHTGGLAVGLYDRVELSLSRQWFDTRAVGGKLGLGKNFTFDQTIAGAKVRLFGDAIYAQDSWLPQVAVGVQYKTNDRAALLSALGARSAQGVDFYISGTKLLLAESLLLNATVRATRANQFGLLGFGGDRHGGYSAQFEGSAAYLLRRNLAFGAEFRTKPDNLRFAREDNAWDVFAAWFLNKNLSATLAYVQLGRIAGERNQGGVYLSLQAGF
jgi:hypothetical protein